MSNAFIPKILSQFRYKSRDLPAAKLKLDLLDYVLAYLLRQGQELPMRFDYVKQCVYVHMLVPHRSNVSLRVLHLVDQGSGSLERKGDEVVKQDVVSSHAHSALRLSLPTLAYTSE